MKNELQKKVSEIIIQLNELGNELIQEKLKSFEINLNNGSKFVWVQEGELNISNNEWKIIQDLRGLKFGHLTITKQDDKIINKEVTEKEKIR